MILLLISILGNQILSWNHTLKKRNKHNKLKLENQLVDLYELNLVDKLLVEITDTHMPLI